MKVTWAQAADYGATLPSELRTELSTLRDADRNENRSWWEFSTERGGWPWRRRFDSDEEHAAAKTEWDTRYQQHLVTLNDLWGRQKDAVARALPLTVDDEPVDLLELLDQQSATPLNVAPPRTSSTVLQAAALQPPAAPGGGPRPEDATRSTQPKHRAGQRR